MTIPAFPTPTPSRAQSQDVFSPAMDAFLAHLPTFVSEANDTATAINAARDAAELALPQVLAAEAAALSAANYKGAWSSLTGPLAIPASVAHSGSVWLLISSLSNVTTSQPGVSADWLRIPDLGDATSLRAGTAGKVVDAAQVYAANAPVTSSGTGSHAFDFNAGRVFQRTLTGNSTLANPTNQVAGQSGMIYIIQDATGGRTLAFGADWKPMAGAGGISTTANAVNVFGYYVRASGSITLTYLGSE
jgi:hypothetical protein